MKSFLPIVAASLSLTLVSVSAEDVKFKEFHGDPSKLTGSGVYRTHNPVNNGWGIWTSQGVGTLNVGYADYSFELKGTTLRGIEMSGKRDFGTRLVIGRGATLKFSLNGQQSLGIALRGKGPYGLNKLDVQDGAHVSFGLVEARTSAKGIETESKSSLNVWNGGTLYFRDIRSTGSNMDDHAVGIYNVHYEHPTIGSTVGYLDVNLTSNGRLHFDNIEANDGRAAGIESATLKLDFKDSEYRVKKIQSRNDSAYGAIVKSGVGDQSITYKLARSSAHYGTISGYWWGVGLEANRVIFDMQGRSSLGFDNIKSVIRDAIGISAESFQFRTNYNNSGNRVVFGNVVSERRHAKGIYAKDVNIVLSNGNSLEFGTIKGRATAKGIDTERLKSRESYVTLAGDIKFRNIESAKEAYGVKVVDGKTMRVGEDSKISNFTNLAFDQVVGNEYAAVLDFTKNTQQGDQTLAITRANINMGTIKADFGRAYGIALWAANQRKITFDNQSSLNVREITGQAQSKLFFAANSDLEVQLNGRSRVSAERIWSRDDAAGFNARNGRIVARDNSSSVFKRIKSENGNAQGFDAQNIHLEGYSASVGAELVEGRFAYGIKASEKATITTRNGGEVWFSKIVSEGGDAYGVKAKNIIMDLRDGGKFAIHDMRSNNGHTYGLYAEKQLEIAFYDNSRLKLGERRTRGSGKNTYGIYLANGANARFYGGGVIVDGPSTASNGESYPIYAKGASVVFEKETRMSYGRETPVTQHRYGLLNSSNAHYEFGNTRFDEISGSDYTYGLYNNSGTMTVGGTLRFAKLVSKNGGKIVGVDNRDKMILQGDGSIVVGNNNSGQQYGIFNSQSGVEFKLGNMDINTRGNNAWGIGTAGGVTTTYYVTGSLAFDVRDQGGNNERKAFESKQVNLNFSKGSSLWFNSGAGHVGKAILNGGTVRMNLAGDAKTKRTGHLLQLRELKFGELNGDGNVNVTLYANSTRKINTKNFDGRAYTDTNLTSRTDKGGSDRLVIENTDNTDNRLKGNLRVVLETFDTQKKYVVLAEVKGNAKDKVIFNDLQNGKTAQIDTEGGYDVAKITIQRVDKNNVAYYVGELPTQKSARIAQRNVDETISSQFSSIATYAANMNSLNKRMGELRDNAHSHGVWTRVFSGQQTAKFGAEAKNTYTTVQAGYDYNLGSEMGFNNYLGLAFSYVDSKTEQVLNQANNTKTKSGEFALYFAHVQDSGLYTDTIAKVSYLDNTMAFVGDNKDYNVTNTAFSLSQEIGYRWQATEGFYITPQVEETFSYINGSELKRQKDNTATLTSKQDALKMLRTRVGLAGTYELPKIEEQFKANFHVGAFYTYDYMSGGETSMISNNQAQEKQSLESNGRFVLNLGTNFAVKDATRMYLDFEKSFGDKLSTDYQINVGVRYSFGQKTAKIDSTNKAPLKVEE